MRTEQTEVLVIGGGATGTGVVRDLAMRGFQAVLVERGDLATGTTGRYHGLLHSGGRYVVKDPQSARECIEENRTLRRIMPQCIEDTGGYFVVTPWDAPEYASKFVEGCREAGIPVEEVSIQQMLQDEPLLNANISRCFRVPDAAADPWLAADLNARSAEEYGATILKYHRIAKLLRDGDQVIGAVCHDLGSDEQVTIMADVTVNASGAWAGQITASIDIPIHIVPGKGVMMAANHRILNTVVNRCKLPSDGDILVPIHTVTVIGTTDVRVSDPDHFAIEPWEVRLMLDEGDKLVPGFKKMRMLRAWAGVRPLYQDANVSDTRDISRSFVLLDHEDRDGVSGLVTITSGKWTTYRKMAEVTVDVVCEKLGVQRPCRTHLEALPAKEDRNFHVLGSRLAQVEKDESYGTLICECELATIDDVEYAVMQGGAKTIDDIRRDVRLGMGPCQGGFCTYRIAGLLHRLRSPNIEETNVALRDFLQERWKGLLPILWGQQLRQERLNELIYLSLLNAEGLPGAKFSRFGPDMYDVPEPDTIQSGRDNEEDIAQTDTDEIAPIATITGGSDSTVDMLVIGAGLAGLVTAWQAALQGLRVEVLSKGWGSLYWHTGCIDLMAPDSRDGRDSAPVGDFLLKYVSQHPEHPYALVGMEALTQAIEDIKALSQQAGYPLHGSVDKNWHLPTGLGTARVTCLAPGTMVSGDLRKKGEILVVGFEGFPDFYPQLIAANLQSAGTPAEGVLLHVDSLSEQRFVTGRVLAEMFDRAEFREEVVRELSLALDKFSVGRIGFPALLGIDRVMEVMRDLESRLGLPVFEIPTLPPSIPGMRLHRLLVAEIEKHGGRVFDGMQVVSASVKGDIVEGIWSEAAARPKLSRARSFVLATGGVLGGGMSMEPDGVLQEKVFGLPLTGDPDENDLFSRNFLSSGGHPIFRKGVAVDPSMQPINGSGTRIYSNLYTVGLALANCDPVQERSIEGVALTTGYVAGRKGSTS